ncbi:MAG: hypothetical protein WCV71_03400 [Patescibacteria group bacterium]|jgi:hypothetical protein
MNLLSELNDRAQGIDLDKVTWPKMEILDPRRLLGIKASKDVKRAWGLFYGIVQDLKELEREHQELCPPEQCRGHCAGTCQSEYDRHLEILQKIKMFSIHSELAHEILMKTMQLDLPDKIADGSVVGIDMNGEYYYHHGLDIKIIHFFV